MLTDGLGFEKIKNTKALVLGDFILDEYVFGEAKRLSPEAVVPVVRKQKTDYRLGGAGNVVANIIALGGNARALTLLGNDKEGDIILNKLRELGCDVSFIERVSGIPSILKTRIVAANSQLLRLDREEYYELPDRFVEETKKNCRRLFQDINVIVISDYNKGFVTKELVGIVTAYANQMGIPVVADPKGNQIDKYANVTMCTPNKKELKELTGVEITSEDALSKAAEMMLDAGIKYVLVTRSEEGMTLFDSLKRTDYPTMAKDIIDVTGAGDTVVAVAACALSSGCSMDTLCNLSNLAASVTISKFGTSAVTYESLMQKISESIGCDKRLSEDTINQVIQKLKDSNKKIVFTNGCFDLCHPGHVHLLKEAARLGDVLIVGLNSDNSVKRIKGEGRPIINEENRAYLLESLEAVDYVVVFDDDTPLELIRKIKPDILVKGEDWKGKKVVGEDILKEYGGRIEFIKAYESFSTTAIIEKMQGKQ